MAVELIVWELVTGIGVTGFLGGLLFRQYYIFVLGCALLIGSGALLWGSNGLITSHYYAVDGTFSNVVVDMSNLGLDILALVFVAVGVLSAMAIDFSSGVRVRRNTYHY